LAGVEIGTRMMCSDCQGAVLLLYSPVRLDADLKRELVAHGEVLEAEARSKIARAFAIV
jgi:hypothetical protein